MRIHASLIVAIALLLAPAAGVITAAEVASPKFDKETFGATAEGIVRILSTHEGKDGKTVGSMGTGTVIDGNVVLTAWHVVDDAEEVTITGWDGRSIKAKDWIRLGDLYDAAIIRFSETLSYPSLPVIGVPEHERRVRVTGFFGPLFGTGRPTLVFGDLIRDDEMEYVLSRTYNTRLLFLVYAPASPGMSGSPILFGEGKICGIVSRFDARLGIYAEGIDLHAMEAAIKAPDAVKKPSSPIKTSMKAIAVPSK